MSDIITKSSSKIYGMVMNNSWSADSHAVLRILYELSVSKGKNVKYMLASMHKTDMTYTVPRIV